MASKTLIKKIMQILAPDVADYLKIKAADRTPEQVEDLEDLEEDILDVLEAIEEHESTSKRLIVVGQIQHKDSEELHTVALGPYGARGVLSDEEKFRKAAEASTAAHDAGGKLAWDTRTGQGQGRYMVVPVFRTPRDAWDFYRTSSDIDSDELVEHVEQMIEDSIRGPVMNDVMPACVCGVRASSGHQSVQGVPVTRKCYRHLGE